MTTIDNVIAGQKIDPDWGNAIADFLNGAIQTGTYTPTLTNVAIGTGGSALNTATYCYVGGPEVGDKGIIVVSGAIILGTTGFSVTGGPNVSLPTGFNTFQADNSGGHRLGLVTLGSTIGAVQHAASDDSKVAFTALDSSTAYATAATISATVPITWAAGSGMRYNFVAPAVRV